MKDKKLITTYKLVRELPYDGGFFIWIKTVLTAFYYTSYNARLYDYNIKT